MIVSSSGCEPKGKSKRGIGVVRLLYHSVSALSSSNEENEIASIVKDSIAWNAQMGVTGALIYTGSRFVQALEGDRDTVEQLVKSIAADPRHNQVTVVHRDQIAERRFSTWQMAYRGPASDLNQTVEELIHAYPDTASAVQHVYEVMEEFAQPRRPGG